MTTVKRFYPALSELVSLSDLPENLDFVKTALTSKLQNLYYKDFQFSGSQKGDASFFNIKIVSNQRIDFEIPGTGVFVVINPDSSSDLSVFPVTVEYEWRILSFIQSFQSASFSEDPLVFFNLAAEILNLDSEWIVGTALNDFVIIDVNSSNSTKGEQLASDINNQYSTESANVQAPASGNVLQQFASSIEQETGVSAFAAIFNTYILDTGDSEKSWKNVKKCFAAVLPKDAKSFILDIILPKVRATLQLSAAIEFPRDILIPVDPATLKPIDESVQPRAKFTFANSTIYFDTQEGVGFDVDFSISSTTPVMIPDWEVVLNVDRLKVDLSETRNIDEADADLRDVSFKGVYFNAVSMSFPPEWKLSDGSEPPMIAGTNVLWGNPGGLSGSFSFSGVGGGSFLDFKVLGIAVRLTSLSFQLERNIAVESDIQGTLKIDNLKDASGNVAELAVSVLFERSGWSVTVKEKEGVQLTLGKFISITLDKLSIGKKDGEFFLELDAKATRKFNMPFIDKLLPTNLEIDPFAYSAEGATVNIQPKWVKESGVKAGKNSNGGFYMKIPLNMSIGGVIDLEAVLLNFFSLDESPTTVDNKLVYDPAFGYGTQILFDGALNISKISASAKGVGVQTNLIPAPEGEKGDIGPFNVDLKFVPPEKIALDIDFDQVKGGGFVWIKEGIYIGGLELNLVEKFGLTALAIIVTKLPDDEKGYSFLTIITVSFPQPIAIGMGFNLKAVGGLLGLHRTMNIDFLRDGLGTGSLDHILFPTGMGDLKKAEALVNAVTSAFPIKKKQYVAGPMFRLDWGTGVSLIDIDLGLMIEFPDPVRIAIMGLVQIRLPKKKIEGMANEAQAAGENYEPTTADLAYKDANSEEDYETYLSERKQEASKAAFKDGLLKSKEIVLINVAFLGVIDFEKKLLSFDASIFSSKIQDITLEGDIAVRLKLGKEPDFLLSIGGFHPEFTPPPLSLPKMKRIRLSLPEKENLSLGIEAYLAITTNTVQFGAKLEGIYEYKDLKAHFAFWLDVLIHFKPFKFLAELGAEVALEYKGVKGLSILLELMVQGPEPWIFKGHASARILAWDVGIDFEYITGTAQIEKPEQVEILAELEEAFDFVNNWNVELPKRNDMAVSLNELPNLPKSISPAGTVVFAQNAVPLNLVLEKFGNSVPKDYRKVWIDKVVLPIVGSEIEFDTLNEPGHFASTAFKDYSDQEKLSLPSFTKFNAGVRVATDNNSIKSPYLNTKVLDFDETTMDRNLTKPKELKQRGVEAENYSRSRNSATAWTSAKADQPVGLKTSGRATLLGKSFTVYWKDSGTAYNSSFMFATAAEAEDKKKDFIGNNPELENELTTGKAA